jgi:hypothetical protein
MGRIYIYICVCVCVCVGVCMYIEVEGTCEYGKKPSGSIKCGEFLG